MQPSGDPDVHSIPLFGIDESDLKRLNTSGLPAESRIEPRAPARGVNMDAAALTIVVPAISSIAVATISAIATIWVAKINARAKAPSEPARPAKPHVVEIETFTTSVVIPIEDGFESALVRQLPATRTITAVRFVSGG